MRIWIINHYALPPTSAGGTRHYSFARQLMQRGHEVLLVAANYNHFSHTYMSSPKKWGEVDYSYDVPFIWIPTPAYKGNTIARFWNMLVFSWRVLRKKYLPNTFPPDVIIGSSPHIFAPLSAQLLSWRLKKPFVLEIRDIWPDTLVDLGRFTHKHPLIKVMKCIERYLYQHADRIISLLPLANKYLYGYGVDPQRITWLPNAIDTDVLTQNMLIDSQLKFTFIYAGAHGLANDLETIIKAAKILQEKGLADNIQIYLVGDGPDKLRLKEIASQVGVTIISFFDAVAKKEIYSILNKADAFIMLLKKSPVFKWGISPNKLFDYLVMGRPVIFGVDTPFNPIAKYHAGISINPSDPDSLAMAMCDLSRLPKNELKDMGLRGKDFVLKEHHIVGLTDKLEGMLKEVVQGYLPNIQTSEANDEENRSIDKV